MTSQMPQGAKSPACIARGLISQEREPILLDAVLLVELIHTAAGVNELLLAGVEGWHLEQISMEMFCFVERVSYTAPQAQRIVVGW